MKAILVINEMPNTCCECKLFWNDVDCGCMALGRAFGEFGCSVGKPIDCPLKPLPQNREPKEEWYNEYHRDEFADGWNACLKEIEK